MKKTLALLLIMLPVYALAQLDIYVRFTENTQAQPDINFYGTKKLSKKFDLTIFTLVEKSWGEALVGIQYNPTDWLSIGLSTGVEVNPAIYRFGASTWLGKGKWSLLLLGEKGDGKDNYWYKTVLSYKPSDRFTVAAVAWRFNGEGLMGRYLIKKIGTTLWVMPSYDFEFEVKRLMIGVNIKM